MKFNVRLTGVLVAYVEASTEEEAKGKAADLWGFHFSFHGPYEWEDSEGVVDEPYVLADGEYIEADFEFDGTESVTSE